MIRYIKQKDLNRNKYDYCIKNAFNSRIYALSWYLDIVTNNDWHAIVLDDYKAVMPIPFKRINRKFLKRMITQPLFCQQLGVFSLSELDIDEFQLFITELYNLKPYVYNFNASNSQKLKENNTYKKRNNFELKLNRTFEEIQKGYSKSLKRNIKKAFKNEFTITSNVTIEDFILMKENNKKHKIKSKQYELMRKIIEAIKANNLGQFYGVKNTTDLIAIAFFIETNNRLVHLFSASTALGKQFGAAPFLLGSIIQKNVNSTIIFDFEGSMVSGIAKFFKSFGAENNPYLSIDNSN